MFNLNQKKVRVFAEVILIDEVEDIVVIVEVVEHHARVTHKLLKLVLLMLPPKTFFLWDSHRLRIYHH